MWTMINHDWSMLLSIFTELFRCRKRFDFSNQTDAGLKFRGTTSGICSSSQSQKRSLNSKSIAPLGPLSATFIHSHHAGMNWVAINRARHKAVLSIAGLRRCNSMWTCCPVQICPSCFWSLDPRGSPRPKSFLRKRILKMARKSMNQWCLV